MNLQVAFITVVFLLGMQVCFSQGREKVMMARYTISVDDMEASEMGLLRKPEIRIYWCKDSLRIENEMSFFEFPIIEWIASGKSFSRHISLQGDTLPWEGTEFDFATRTGFVYDSLQLSVHRARRRVDFDGVKCKVMTISTPDHRQDLQIIYQKRPDMGPLVHYWAFMWEVKGFPVIVETISGYSKGQKMVLVELKEIEGNGSLFHPR